MQHDRSVHKIFLINDGIFTCVLLELLLWFTDDGTGDDGGDGTGGVTVNVVCLHLMSSMPYYVHKTFDLVAQYLLNINSKN